MTLDLRAILHRTMAWLPTDSVYTSSRQAEVKLESLPTHYEIHFQGSCDPSDWFYNFLFLPWRFRHLGFYLLFRSLRSHLESELLPFLGDKPLYFVGFSQGAALALLASAHYQYPAIAFGSPRPFFLPFGRKKPAPGSLCFSVRNDIVPKLPFFPFSRRLRVTRLPAVKTPLFPLGPRMEHIHMSIEPQLDLYLKERGE